MVKNRPERRKRPWLCDPGHWLRLAAVVLTLSAAVPALYGKGQQDDVLSRADELIAAKRYNEALGILSEYAKQNPKHFDTVQSRIRQVMRVKDEYNLIAQELLTEMEKEEPDNERILALTNYLYELDPQRIAETQDFIARTREVALFRSNQRRLERILAQGQALIARGEYTEALRVYAGGLDIYQADFFAGAYGAALENRARQGITNLTGNIALFNSVSTSLLDAVNDLAALENQGIELQNLTVYRNAYNRVGTEIDRLTALRNSYAGTDSAFREDLAQVRSANPQNGDRNFLAFAVRLMVGRSDDPGDGMLGLFDTLWDQAVPRARDLVDTKAHSVYTAVITEAQAREYSRIGARSEVLAGYASLPVDLEIRWNRYDTGSSKATLFNQDIPLEEAGNYLKFRALAESSGYLRTVGQLGVRLAAADSRDTVALWRSGGNPDELIRAEQSGAALLRQIQGEAQSLVSAIRRETEEYRALETRYPDSGGLEYINGVGAIAADLVNSITVREEDSAARRFTIANGMVESQILQRETEFQQGSALVDGTLQDGYLSKRPAEGAALLTRMDGAIDANRQALQNLLNQYTAEPPEVQSGSRFQSFREDALALQSRLETTRSQGRALAAAARSQAAQAEALRTEANGNFEAARAAMNQGDFDAALDRLDRAEDIYNRSLELEDNEAARDRRDNAVSALSAEVTQRLNEAVFRDVEVLVTQISEAYFRGDFDQAENLVTRAQNRWRRTQRVENPEIAYWRRMIQTGQRSGRTILPTAPLYAEMSQLLSEARKNYEEGREIIGASRNEGIKKLEQARQNIQKVKLVYPMNEEAGLLDLRIEQVSDPPGFERTFETRVNTAISGCRQQSIQAYADLLNLFKIYPEYPNRAAIVYQAEIDVGMRPRPPSEGELARSRELTATAGSIVASGNMARMEEARDYLKEAIELNPDNREAKTLFTQASNLIAVSGLRFDSESQRLFNQAGQLIAQQNGVGALQLINQIYARNPQYRLMRQMITIEQRARALL
jgi:tetratricopeptide (TPR) repeat protein